MVAKYTHVPHLFNNKKLFDEKVLQQKKNK